MSNLTVAELLSTSKKLRDLLVSEFNKLDKETQRKLIKSANKVKEKPTPPPTMIIKKNMMG